MILKLWIVVRVKWIMCENGFFCYLRFFEYKVSDLSNVNYGLNFVLIILV